MLKIDIKKKKKLENDVYKMVKGNVSISKLQEMTDLSIYQEASSEDYYFYPKFLKLPNGQIYGLAVHRCKFMSNVDVVVDTIYFTEPFREISKKLYSNEFGFRGYKDVFKAVVEKAGVADMREAAYMLAYYTAPGNCFVDGHYPKPKVQKVFDTLYTAYILLSEDDSGSISVLEKNNGKTKVYQFDGEKCTVVKHPTFLECCEPYEIRPFFMWEAYKKDHPKFRTSSKAVWEGQGLPYIPIVEKCGNKNVLFTHKRDLDKLKDNKLVTWTKTIDEIDEVYAYGDRTWEKVDMTQYAEQPKEAVEQPENVEQPEEQPEETVETEEQPETPLVESVKPEQPENVEQSEEPIGQPMTAEELKETVDKMVSQFRNLSEQPETTLAESAKPEEKESKPRLMKLDSIEN